MSKVTFKPNKKLMSILKKRIEKALKDTAKVVESEAKNKAPVLSGKLKKSIRIDDSQIKKGTILIGSDVDYADDVEFGTFKSGAQPFLRPAINKAKKPLIQNLKKVFK